MLNGPSEGTPLSSHMGGRASTPTLRHLQKADSESLPPRFATYNRNMTSAGQRPDALELYSLPYSLKLNDNQVIEMLLPVVVVVSQPAECLEAQRLPAGPTECLEAQRLPAGPSECFVAQQLSAGPSECLEAR